MTRDLMLLLTMIVAGAALLLVHAWLLARVARAQRLSRRLRWLALLPPLTPIVGWRAGARASSALWVLLAAVYVLVRSLG